MQRREVHPSIRTGWGPDLFLSVGLCFREVLISSSLWLFISSIVSTLQKIVVVWKSRDLSLLCQLVIYSSCYVYLFKIISLYKQWFSFVNSYQFLLKQRFHAMISLRNYILCIISYIKYISLMGCITASMTYFKVSSSILLPRWAWF